MSALRAIWLPAIVAAAGVFLITWLAGEAMRHEALGTSGFAIFRWLIDPLLSRLLMLAIIASASFWSGFRVTQSNNDIVGGAMAGAAIPVSALLVLIFITILGGEEVDISSYLQIAALVNIVIAVAIAGSVGAIGAFVGRRKRV